VFFTSVVLYYSLQRRRLCLVTGPLLYQTVRQLQTQAMLWHFSTSYWKIHLQR